MNIIAEKDVIISDLVSALHDGKTLVYPTETCYGLGCDATNALAVEKIFAIKGREKGKPLPMIVHDLGAMASYIEITPALEELAKKYWPGPLTVIVPAKAGGTVAFRVTSHPFAHALAEAFGKPIVSTSANVSGGPNPYTIEEAVSADIGIDAGPLPRRAPSTIVRLHEGRMEVVRQGSVRIMKHET